MNNNREKLDKFLLIETQLGEMLECDVLGVAYGLFSMNALHSMGYLFNTEDNIEVSRGMFCDFRREIGCGEWDYYFSFEDRKFYKIETIKQ